ncbi:hypothetical protein WG66_011270 [Moniliophthora roreri]|nr:hypothetical protein WG66_011270 [Moniliophthora roreri]
MSVRGRLHSRISQHHLPQLHWTARTPEQIPERREPEVEHRYTPKQRLCSPESPFTQFIFQRSASSRI